MLSKTRRHVNLPVRLILQLLTARLQIITLNFELWSKTIQRKYFFTKETPTAIQRTVKNPEQANSHLNPCGHVSFTTKLAHLKLTLLTLRY